MLRRHLPSSAPCLRTVLAVVATSAAISVVVPVAAQDADGTIGDIRREREEARDAEAAALLGISESALKARLKSARERLYARTTAEAIQRAQEYKLL